jgi:hypothetical protein
MNTDEGQSIPADSIKTNPRKSATSAVSSEVLTSMFINHG